MDYLKFSLENSHYNLNAFTSKLEFETNLEEVRKSINKDSLNLKEATGIFQRIISKANTGHAEIDFPAQAYIPFALNGGTVFPLELSFEEGKVYIRKNFSGIDKIEEGTELLMIEGFSIEKILDSIYPYLSAERTYFKNAKLEFWSFPRLFWQVFGEKEEYEVKIKDGNKIISHRLSAINALEDYEYKRKDVFDFPAKLKFIGRTAYLYPGPFNSKEEDGEAVFKGFIDSVFTQVREQASKNLIIDLRYNSGGHDSFSNYLIAYFADKPFKWNSSLSIKTSAVLKEHTRNFNDTTDAYFKAILEHEEGERFLYNTGLYDPVSKRKRFKGEVYVLVNRQTHSMAAVAAALIQDYGFGTIVGEETGEFPSLHASQFSFTLPNTDVVVKVPKGYIVRPSGKEDMIGVVPEIIIKDHLLDEEDEILEGILRRLEK